MTTDETNLIVDDGTSNLYFYEPSTLKLVKKMQVTEGDALGYNLNELEYTESLIDLWQ